MPAFVRRRLEGRHDLQRTMGNSFWLLFDKVFRLGAVFLLNIWITRYLGPERFGLLSYAIAFVSLFTAIANLGLFGIVLRDVVKYPESRDAILGTALVLKLIGGIASFLMASAAIFIMRPHDTGSVLLVAIVAAGNIFQAFDVFDFWFLSQLQSKSSLLANLPGFLLCSLIKIMLVLAGASLEAFAWMLLVEILLASIGFVVMYQRITGDFRKLHFSFPLARTMLSDSTPLLFAGIMMMVYTRIDQVMLGQMLGDGPVGVYSAATRIGEFWYVFPVMVLQSFFPSIIESRKSGDVRYYAHLQNVFDIVVLFSCLFVVPFCLGAKPVIQMLYGDAYRDAGPILAVYVWAGVFVIIGHVREYWVTVENITFFSLYSTTLGALVNVLLNFLLIPAYGGLGAAYATLIAVAAGSYGINALSRRSRRIFILQTKSLLLIPSLLRLAKHYAVRQR